MAESGFFDITDYWEANRDEFETTFKESGITGVAEKVEKSISERQTTSLYIGVTGSSGAGKSTFINTIRGLEPYDEGAADTGVMETTLTLKTYPHPDNEMLKLVDMPGVSTPKFKKDNYCDVVEFDKIDMFIIITHKRFTENDVWLCREILKRKKKFLFLRSHAAQDLKNEKKRRKKEYEKYGDSLLTDIIKDLRERTKKELEKELSDVVEKDNLKIYLIDSLKPNHPLLDFSLFSKNLIEDFPGNKKKALILTLSHLTPPLIDEKENLLRGEIWKKALTSAAGATIPILGASLTIDIAIILSAARDYRKQFGLESHALEKLAKSIKTSSEELCTSAGLTSVGFELTTASILRLCSEMVAKESVELVSVMVPIIGSFVSSIKSYKGTSFSLNKVLSIMANDARKVHTYVQSKLLLNL